MAKRRKGGTGSVHLREDGRWEGRVVIGYDENGLPKTKNVLVKTKAECEEKLKALLVTQKGAEPKTPQQNMTVAQWLDFWYQPYKKPNLRPNTQMSYERRIYQHIIPNLGPIPLNKLTTGDIQQFYVALKQIGRLLRRNNTAKVFLTKRSGASTPLSMRRWTKRSPRRSSQEPPQNSAASPLPKPERCRY